MLSARLSAPVPAAQQGAGGSGSGGPLARSESGIFKQWRTPPFVRVFSLLKTISGRLPMGPLDYGQFPRFLLVQKASTAVVVVWWQVTAALVEGNVLSVFGNLLVASYSSRRAKVSLHL